MSVSSHLNPEPERRLWIIHESLRRSVEWNDVKLISLLAFSAGEIALVRYAAGGNFSGALAVFLLAAALPVALAALSPLMDAERQFPLLDPRLDRRQSGDSLIVAADIARYPQLELVILLDKYLGGGITATRYYEDIVAQIVLAARVATRKHRLFMAACALCGAAQLCLLWRLVPR
jgi:hypothetical protein